MSFFNITIFDQLGLVGVVFTLLGYFLLQLGRTALRGWFYSSLNIIGSTLVLLSLIEKFNLSAFAMEFAWLIISIYGLVKVYHHEKCKNSSHDADD